jgi:hypothetical protein
MYCVKCGEKNSDDSRFCCKCGAQLQAPAAPSPDPTPVIPTSAAPVYVAPTPVVPADVPTPVVGSSAEIPAADAVSDAPTPVPEPEVYAPEPVPAPEAYTPEPDAYAPPADTYVPTPTSSSDGYVASPPASGGYFETPVAVAERESVAETLYDGAPKRGGGFLKRGWWLILCGVVVIGAVVYIATLFTDKVTPTKTLAAALSTTSAETAQRLSNSPLGIVSVLPKSVKGGSIGADISYTDYWGDVYAGEIAILANTKTREFGITAEGEIYGTDVDLEAYINPDRAIIHSSLIDSKYYGLDYATFADELSVFLAEVGLDDSYSQDLIDAVKAIDEALSSPPSDGKTESPLEKKLSKVFADAAKKMDITSKNEKLDGQTVQVLTYTVPKEAITALLDGLYNLAKNDAEIKAFIESYIEGFGIGQSFFGGGDYDYDYDYDYDWDDDIFAASLSGVSPAAYGGVTSYDSFMAQFKDLIDQFKSDIDMNLVYTFRIDKNERLLDISAACGVTYDGETASVELTLDFGDGADDTWYLEATVTEPDGTVSAFTLKWEYTAIGSKYTNTFSVSIVEDDYETTTGLLVIKWEGPAGAFDVSVGESKRDLNTILSGYLELGDDNFRLEIDGDNSLEIAIWAKSGVTFPAPKYVPLKDWGYELVEKLYTAIWEFMGY